MRISLVLLALSLPLFALPPDAAAIKARRDVKISQVNVAYVKALEKIKKRALSDGDLSGAKEIEKEIDAATMLPLATFLVTGSWVYSIPKGESTTLKFLNDGTAINTKNGREIWKEWRVIGESLVITLIDGTTCVFAFNGVRDGEIPGKTNKGLNRTLRPKLGNAG